MRLVRVVGLCLLAVFGFAAVASATASAELPALYECHKVASGTGIWNKGCKVEGKHNKELKENDFEIQEWNLVAKKGKAKIFKGKNKTGANLEDLSLSSKLSCTSYTDEGYFTGPKTAGKIKVIFKGCTLSNHSCKSPGAEAGQVKVNPLEGEDGYISRSKHEVGALLRAEATGNPDRYIAEIECDEGQIKLRTSGAVIGRIEAPLGVFTKSATFNFIQHAAVNEWTEQWGLEGNNPKDKLGTEILTGGGPLFSEPPCEPKRLEKDEIGGCYTGSGEETKVTNKGEELELVA